MARQVAGYLPRSTAAGGLQTRLQSLYHCKLSRLPAAQAERPPARPPARRPAAPSLSHICRGLLPMLYRMERKPDWKEFLNKEVILAR